MDKGDEEPDDGEFWVGLGALAESVLMESIAVEMSSSAEVIALKASCQSQRILVCLVFSL